MIYKSEYIAPNLLLESSYMDLLKQFDNYGPMIAWTREEKQIELADLLRQDCVFVVGEPGQGKSRLVRELAALAQADGYGTSVVRLNKLGRDQSIEDALSASEEQVNFDVSAKTKMLVCLDALDEVTSSKFPDTVQQVRQYLASHPGHKVVITSRIHFFTKYEESLAPINASYALLMPLDRQAQIKLLKQYGLTDPQINEAFLKLRQQDKETVLQTPRYLEYFAQWYVQHGIGKKALSRSDIFDHFVNQALGEEDKKVDKRIAALRRRTLEKLALVMEIAQTNAISQDDMITFIEDYKSEAKLLLLGSTDDLDTIYNHGLLKDDGEKIAFDNAELQEYLAASTINRMDDPGRAAFQLAIDKDQRAIHPSWYSTLSFLLEMQPGLLTGIINLEKATPENPERPQDPETHKLISGVSSELITAEAREAIFIQVLGYYLENDIYIRFEVSTRLAFYSTPGTDAYLKKCAEQLEKSKSYANLVNIAQIAGSLKRVNRLNDENYWKKKLRTWALLDGEDDFTTVLKRQAVHALEFFSDEALIDELTPLHSHENELVRRAYEGMCDAIDANNLQSVNVFVEGIKHDSIEARMYLRNVTSKEGILALLSAMATDEVFLHELIEHDSTFRKDDNKFFRNTDKKMDAELLEKCKEVIHKVFDIDHGYYVDRSSFIDQLVELIAKHDPNYFTELINWALEDNEIPRFFDLQLHLSKMMRKSDTKLLNELINGHQDIKGHLLRIATILDDPASPNPDAKDIISELRELQPELFKEYDEAVRKMSLRGQRDRTQEEFDKMMQLVIEHGHINALNKALEMFNKEDNSERFGKNADKYLWSHCKKIILDPLDPATATLAIHEKKPDGSQPFTISNYIWAYGEIAKFASKTSKDISSYRKKFVALLAFTYNEDTDACLDLLGALSSEESKILIDTFNNLSSDRARFHPSNFIDAVKRFHLTEAVDILDAFVDQEEFDIYVRRDALELSENLKPNKERLSELVKKYSDENKEYSLKRTANGLLITKHDDPEAIKWLMQKIKDSAAEFVEKTGVHNVGALEHELHDGEIAKPLRELSDARYIDDYLDLLDFSFQLFAKGDKWHNYTYYIWKIVTGYFDQLKNGLKFEPLMRLEKWVSEHPKLPGINYFKDKMVELRRSYTVAIDRPKNINAAIKLAEKVRTEDGAAISSVEQLKSVLEKIIREELIPWIETDARKIMNETHAQKLIKVQLEASLLKNGFNPSQLQVCHIIREAQELDDTRTDFLIYHGFIGPVIIELKLFSNKDLHAKDLTTKKSYESLKNYTRQYKTNHAILLALDNEIALERDDLYKRRAEKIADAYTTISGASVHSARLFDRVEKTKKPKQKKKK